MYINEPFRNIDIANILPSNRFIGEYIDVRCCVSVNVCVFSVAAILRILRHAAETPQRKIIP